MSCLCHDDTGAAPLLCEYPKAAAPLPLRLLTGLPRPWLHALLTRFAAPAKPPIDGCDVVGERECDPYDIVELVPGKVWQVRYQFLIGSKLSKMLAPMGARKLDDLPGLVPAEMQPTLARDIAQTKRARALAGSKKSTLRDRLDSGLFFSRQSMVVVKLGSGELLLYNPCRMHPRILHWLAQRGPVGWVVSGSSAHTLQLPGVAKAFPYARLVGSAPAALKCDAVGVRRFEYDASLASGPRSLAEANAELGRAGGAQLHHIEGDAMCNATLLWAHGVLVEVDLLYGDPTGQRWAWATAEAWRSDPELCSSRIFFYVFFFNHVGSACPDSPFGCLPVYRYFAMDPTSAWSKLLTAHNGAASALQRDGSSVGLMAASLRQLLALDFDSAVSCHSLLPGTMSAGYFKRCIDAAWRWLDGKTLIQADRP